LRSPRARAERHQLLLQEEGDDESHATRDAIAALAEAAGVPVAHVPRARLDSVTRNAVHNGVALEASALSVPLVTSLQLCTSPPGAWAWRGAGDRVLGAPFAPRTPAAPPLLLALDEVQDVHNLGALLRSAWFLGADGVLLSRRNCAPLTGAALKAAVGAADAWAGVGRLAQADKLFALLARARDEGWTVLGADAGAAAVEAGTVARAGATVLVLGNERRGLRTLVRDACSRLVRVPAAPAPPDGDADAVDSLNVSVAAGVLLWQLRARPA
jgi:21S rRNA (GM2251-2'-O)-methyltransferase